MNWSISVIFFISSFVMLNASSWGSFHSQGLSFFSRGRSGAPVVLNLATIDSFELLTSRKSAVFTFLFLNFSVVAWIFEFNALIPVLDSLNPIQSVSVLPTCYFSNSRRTTASNNIFRTSITFCKCCSHVPFVTMRMSSMKANVFFDL